MSCLSRAGPLGAAAALVVTLSACHPSSRPSQIPASRTLSAVLSLQQRIDAVLADPALRRSYWGVLAGSLTAGDTLYSRNADKLMMPASNMKIVTLAAAADRLGWDYTYQTQLLSTSPVKNDTLDGDLIAVGSGDPTIGHDGPGAAVFESWAERLKASGVRTIRGRIIGDDNAFEDETLGPGWAWDYLAEGYATGVGALQFNENVVSITMRAGTAVGEPVAVSMTPEGSGLDIRNNLTTAPAGAPTAIVARRLPGSTRLELRGTVTMGASVAHTVSVDNPTLFFVNALRLTLVAHGIDVQGPAVDIDDLPVPPSRTQGTVLATYRSPSLATLAVRMMKVSQNLYAETLLKTIGTTAGLGTVNAGRAAVLSTLQSWDVAPQDLIMVDGSGLSRYDLIAPQALVGVLTHVARDEHLRSAFNDALPVAGRDGTLAGRMKGTPAEDNARAKTGAIASARGLSGYVKTANEETLVFSILANNFETTADVIDRAADAIVVQLAEFRR